VILGQEHTEYAWVGIPELKEMQYLDKYVREMLNLEKNIFFS
jgi:hypothetical protein